VIIVVTAIVVSAGAAEEIEDGAEEPFERAVDDRGEERCSEVTLVTAMPRYLTPLGKHGGVECRGPPSQRLRP